MKIRKFLSFVNLQRKVKFVPQPGARSLIDLYFRDDHYDFQEKIRQSAKCHQLTSRVYLNALNIINIIYLAIVLILKKAGNPYDAFLDELVCKYTGKVVKKLSEMGCRELHSLSYNSMEHIISISRYQCSPQIITFEYQHGLIFWKLFNLDRLPPNYFVCASDDDMTRAHERMKGTVWSEMCTITQSNISNSYIYYDDASKATSSLDLWNGKVISYVHGPIIVNGVDITISLMDRLIEISKVHSVIVKIFPHPSSVSSLRRRYFRNCKGKHVIEESDLVLGFFSSKLLKCLREGFNVMQLRHDDNNQPFQPIPMLTAVMVDELEKYIISHKISTYHAEKA